MCLTGAAPWWGGRGCVTPKLTFFAVFPVHRCGGCLVLWYHTGPLHLQQPLRRVHQADQAGEGKTHDQSGKYRSSESPLSREKGSKSKLNDNIIRTFILGAPPSMLCKRPSLLVRDQPTVKL